MLYWSKFGQTLVKLSTYPILTERPHAHMPQTFGSIDRLPSRKDTPRAKYGRWRARYTAPNGQRIHAPATFATKLEAQGWLAEERRLLDLGVWQPPRARLEQQQAEKQRDKTTVGKWVTQWLDRRKANLRLSTWQSYERVVKNRITEVHGAPGVSKLAETPLAVLDKAAVYEWWDAMTRTFDTPPTNRKAYIYLRAAMGDAVERGMIPANPVVVKDARAKPVPKDKELPTVETLTTLVKNLPARYQLVGVLCLMMGLRIGEALAVTRDQLVNHGTPSQPQWVVQVRGNLQRVQDDNGRTVMTWQPPKTKAGRRDVPIFGAFNDVVQSHLDHYAPAGGRDYLTTTAKGQPVMDTSFRSVLERAGLRAGVSQRVTPHYGRNWLITHLAEEGATPAEIGYLLGQTDLKTITEVYMKARPENMGTVLARVGNRLAGGGEVVPIRGRGVERGA